MTGLMLIMVAIGFFIKDQNEVASRNLIILGLFLFLFVYGATLGPVSWIYSAEVA